MPFKKLHTDSYLTDHGRVRYQNMCRDLQRQNDELLKELEPIPDLARLAFKAWARVSKKLRRG